MKIGIVIVAYNSALTIERTLKSIAHQIVLPDKVLIVDGKSTDNTLQIVSKFKELPITLVSEKDEGIYNAMNKGLRLIDTDVVGFLNSDDAYTDVKFIQRMYSVFRNQRQQKIFLGGVRYVNNSGDVKRVWRVSHESLNFRNGGHPPHPGFYAKRELLLEIGGFNESYNIAADFDLMLRALSRVNPNEVFLDNNLIVDMLEGGESNRSVINILRGNAEVRDSLNRNGIEVGFVYTVKRILKKISKYKF